MGEWYILVFKLCLKNLSDTTRHETYLSTHVIFAKKLSSLKCNSLWLSDYVSNNSSFDLCLLSRRTTKAII